MNYKAPYPVIKQIYHPNTYMTLLGLTLKVETEDVIGENEWHWTIQKKAQNGDYYMVTREKSSRGFYSSKREAQKGAIRYAEESLQKIKNHVEESTTLLMRTREKWVI